MARPPPRTSLRWPPARVARYAILSLLAPVLVALALELITMRAEPPGGLAQGEPPPPGASAPRPEASLPSRAPVAASSASAAPIEVAPAASASATAIDGLDAVAWRRLLRAAAAASDWKKGAASIRALLKLDPAALSEPQITDPAADVTAMVTVVDAPAADALFDALSAAPGGLDVLYALVAKRAGSKSADRARDLLHKPEVRALASPALAVALGLREGNCSEKDALSERAGEVGDHRALGLMVALRSPDCDVQVTGCCLVHSAKAQAAVQALVKRLRPAGAAAPRGGTPAESDPYE